MGLDERGRLIVRSGIALLNVKEELLDIELREGPDKDGHRTALLEDRKSQLLTRVGDLVPRRDGVSAHR